MELVEDVIRFHVSRCARRRCGCTASSALAARPRWPRWPSGPLVALGRTGRTARELTRPLARAQHKVTPYTGRNAAVVEAVRKADLIDFSLGVLANGVSRHDIAKVMGEIPMHGFHASLVRLLFSLPKPWSIVEIFYW